MRAIGKRIWRYKVWIFALIILAVAAKAGSDYYSKSSKPAFTGTVVTVERGDIQAVVAATGTISPVNSVDVSSKITGRIVDVKVNENDPVKADQILILLDDTRYQTIVSQAQARLANAAANYDRTSRLAAIGAVADQQLDAARMDYQVAQATYDDAVSQLEDTVIKAPIDGTVIGKPIPAGQTVAPGISSPMVLLTIADMSKMQISVQVDESDVGQVNNGQKVSFTVDSYPGRTFTGIVSNVSNKASVTQNVVYYPVTVDVDSPAGLLKPTMTARVSIHVGESKDVLNVPLAAVKQSKGQQYVQALKDGKPQNVPVELGLASDDRVEITTGLKDGDQVLLSTAKSQASQSAPQGGNPLRGIR